MFPLLIAAAATAGLSMPPTQDFAVSMQNRFPIALLRQEPAAAAALVDLLFAPDGELVRCTTEAIFGVLAVARNACAYAMIASPPRHGGSFQDGTPAYAQWRTLITYNLSEVAEILPDIKKARQPDAIFNVTHLPPGYDGKPVAVTLAVDQKGVITDCAFPADTRQPALAAAICANRDRLNAAPLTDDHGHPIAYVTRQSVAFALDVGTSNAPTRSPDH